MVNGLKSLWITKKGNLIRPQVSHISLFLSTKFRLQLNHLKTRFLKKQINRLRLENFFFFTCKSVLHAVVDTLQLQLTTTTTDCLFKVTLLSKLMIVLSNFQTRPSEPTISRYKIIIPRLGTKNCDIFWKDSKVQEAMSKWKGCVDFFPGNCVNFILFYLTGLGTGFAYHTDQSWTPKRVPQVCFFLQKGTVERIYRLLGSTHPQGICIRWRVWKGIRHRSFSVDPVAPRWSLFYGSKALNSY